MIDPNLKEIIRELIEMGEKDQECRKKLIDQQPGKDDGKVLVALDKTHTKKLKAILTQIGLPTISKVGKKASLYAWLIAQHTPDKKFMEEYLSLIKKHRDDIDPKNYALMQDRVNMQNRKPQTYGTQFQRGKEGDFVSYKVRDRKNLDARREEVGLPPLAKYIKQIAKSYKANFHE